MKTDIEFSGAPDIRRNDEQPNNTHHKDIQANDNHHNATQHNVTQ